MKQVKQTGKLLPKLAKKCGDASLKAACVTFFCQPKVPAQLNRTKRK